MEPYEFNAPKFVDFTVPDAGFNEDFFGTCQSMDTLATETASEVMPSTSANNTITGCGDGATPQQPSKVEDELTCSMEVLQISSSVPVATASTSTQHSCCRTHPNSSSRKSHLMFTRLDTVTGRVLEPLDFAQGEALTLGNNGVNAEDLPAAPRPRKDPVGKLSAASSEPNLHKRMLEHESGNQDRRDNPQKYISLAEAVLKFHKKTPQRFHSRFPGNVLLPQQPLRPRDPTVPCPPQLTACTRVRQVQYPTREEREALEVAQINQYKITAQPLDPRVFRSPKLGVRVPKVTEPEPFNLTEVVKKVSTEAAPSYKFTAQPVPKNLLAPRGGPICSPATRSSAVAKRRLERPKAFATSLQVEKGEKVLVQKEVFNFGVPTETRKNTPLKKSTELKPFSFEDRDRENARRKEERIKMYLEEEKQARIFHAKPLPNFHRKKLGSIMNLTFMSTDSSVKASPDENKAPPVPFKANPATVLHKEPFVPHRPERSPLRPSNLILKTEVRAKERKEFDKKVQAELEELEEFRREYEKEQQLEAEAQLAALRKQAESFRARPAPKFKTPKKVVSDRKLTSPQSPFPKKPADDNH